MTAILNFHIFAKNAKTQICFYLHFFKMGTWSVSQKWSGFRHFVGITIRLLFDNLSHAEVLALYLQS